MIDRPSAGASAADTSAPLRITTLAILYFFLAIASREGFRQLPADLATPAWKASWLGFCFAGLWHAHRSGPRRMARELGLDGSMVGGLGMALATTSPMLVGLLFMSPGGITFDAGHLLESVVLAALSEEILFRGYLFRQLYRRGGWGFAPAVLVTGLLFGLAHVSSAIRGGIPGLFGVVGITTVGGIFFAWLFVRWNDNLWVPIGVHLFMNGWWELFAAGPEAIGTSGGNLARGAAILTIVTVTLARTEPLAPRRPEQNVRRSPEGSRDDPL